VRRSAGQIFHQLGLQAIVTPLFARIFTDRLGPARIRTCCLFQHFANIFSMRWNLAPESCVFELFPAADTWECPPG
jgi:hypothetical protein